MKHFNTIIVGGGQAGLAASRCLTALGRDHVVLERGRVAERWHNERWDSLRLLTPNWMTRLPGYAYDGGDPRGFMTGRETAAFLDGYASSFDAPVLEHTSVQDVSHDGERFQIVTDTASFRSDNVIIATGWCDRPAIPAAAASLATDIHQVSPALYKRPTDIPSGGVLVVGASATGVQLADELQASGRQVTLAVGSHSRMPRTYRGMDAYWWLDLIGSLDKTIDDVDDVVAARTEPSLQLVGHPDHRTLDLTTLRAAGVRLVGRVNDVDGHHVSLGRDLRAVVEDANLRMERVLARIDAVIDRLGLHREVLDAEPIPMLGDFTAPDSLDLRRDRIRTVIWATGYRRSYDWLRLPILDGRGEIAQYRGVTEMPGAYVLGQRFQHRRNSNFIDGVGRDAQFVAEHICGIHSLETSLTACR